MVAEHLIDRAAFGDHPLGPHRARARRSTCARSRATGSSPSASAAGRAARGGAFLVGNLEHVPDDGELAELFGRFPTLPAPDGASSRRRRSSPQTLVEQRDSNQSHLRMFYRPAIDAADPRAARGARRSTRRCSAARWARACSTRSASSAASLLRLRASTTPSPTCRSCSSAPGSTRRKCVEAYTRMREIVAELRDDGPDRGGGRARPAYAAGRRVLAFENTNAVARY